MASKIPDHFPTIYVDGLHQSCTQDKLRETLSIFGRVVGVSIKDGRHGYAKKFAFISFTSIEEVEKAVASSGTLMLDGQKLIIKHSYKNSVHSMTSSLPEQQQQHDTVFKQEPNRRLKSTEMQLLVTHVETPVQFYAQIYDTRMLGTVYTGLAAHCPSADRLSGIPSSNQVYGSKYSVDDNWYRCKVVKPASESQSVIFFIDYGNCEVVENKSLVQLPAHISELAPLAKMFYLYGLEVNDEAGLGKSCEFFTFAADMAEVMKPSLLKAVQRLGAALLLSLVNSQAIRALVYDGNLAELFGSDGRNLGEQMVAKGYCVSARINMSLSGGGDSRMQHPPVITASSSNSSFTSSASDKTWRKPGTVPLLMDEPIDRSAVLPKLDENSLRKPLAALATGSRPLHNGCSTSASITSCASSLSDSDASLHKQLQEYRSCIEKQAAECSHLKEQLVELKSRPSLDEQLIRVVATAASVKKLRQTLILDDNPIISSIAQLSEEERQMKGIANTLLADVESAVSSYDEIQDGIRLTYMSLDKTKALEIVRQRDAARKKLCEAINHFERQIGSLDLDGRMASIQAAIAKVDVAHANLMISHTELEETVEDDQLEQLLKWQADRTAVTTALRDSSDAAVQTLSNRVLTLIQSLDMTRNASEASAWTSGHSFEADIDSCSEALTAELEHSHIVPDSADVAVINRGVKAFASLALAVRKVMVSLEEGILRYGDMRDRLIPWITKTLELTQALTLWKNLKMLRSRLRHRLADKQDIIENVHDDSVKASNDLAAITDELSHLQPQLQQCCVTLEGVLRAVAADCSEHFPELTLQHNDLGIAEFAKYCGLYSPFRDLEHFSDIRHEDGSTNWLCVFNGQPVEIRQYLAGSAGYPNKAAVLTHFMKVKQLWETDLQSAFFSRNQSEVLVQVISHTECLASLRRPLNSYDVATYSSQILVQLQKLHAKDFVYGFLNPKTVFVEPYGCVLDVPGLPTQKNCKSVDINGLTFNQEEASKLSDLKDFGKLIVWMCCPESEQPALSHVSHSRELYDLVTCLLYGQPKFTAEEILAMPYFTTSCSQPASMSPSQLQLATDVVCTAAIPDLRLAADAASTEAAADAAAIYPPAAAAEERYMPAEAMSPRAGPPAGHKVPTSAWLAATTQFLLSPEVVQAVSRAEQQPVEGAESAEPSASAHVAPMREGILPVGDLGAASSEAAPASK